MHFEAVNIIAGKFIHADLKTVLPIFHQHVKCASRGASELDKVYTNIKLAYRARPLPHRGQSDHMSSMLLILAFNPLRKTALTTTRIVKTWLGGASLSCFDRTSWDIFEHQNLEVDTDTVMCTDIVTMDKHIRIYYNRKP